MQMIPRRMEWAHLQWLGFSIESLGTILEVRHLLGSEGWQIVGGNVALRTGKGGYLPETVSG